jgi:chorismate mutase/prephenate dehydratase
MSQKLDEIRKKIDALDDRIHDLLMERAELIVEISAEKKKTEAPTVQPSREAKVIRRILARHKGPLPEATVVKIWRELIGAASLLQKGIKISVSSDEKSSFCWDLAKDYFGAVLPMIRASAPVASISAVREDEVTFAVLPWPHDGEAMPWWQHLMNRDQNMRIVSAMPFGMPGGQPSGRQNRAVVISKTDFKSSGEDRTFVIMSIGHDISRAKIIDVFKDIKLQVLSVYTKAKSPGTSDGVHLVEVDDYLEENDERLKTITEKLNGMNARMVVVGGYPAPSLYKSAEKPAEKTEAMPTSATEQKTGTQ